MKLLARSEFLLAGINFWNWQNKKQAPEDFDWMRKFFTSLDVDFVEIRRIFDPENERIDPSSFYGIFSKLYEEGETCHYPWFYLGFATAFMQIKRREGPVEKGDFERILIQAGIRYKDWKWIQLSTAELRDEKIRFSEHVKGLKRIAIELEELYPRYDEKILRHIDANRREIALRSKVESDWLTRFSNLSTPPWPPGFKQNLLIPPRLSDIVLFHLGAFGTSHGQSELPLEELEKSLVLYFVLIGQDEPFYPAFDAALSLLHQNRMIEFCGNPVFRDLRLRATEKGWTAIAPKMEQMLTPAEEWLQKRLQKVETAPEAPLVEISDSVRHLSEIPTGNAAAADYHKTIFNILIQLFGNELERPYFEEILDEGHQRADITFANRVSSGFFERLSNIHKIQCPWIFIECKNYASDVGNPEFGQIVLRLNNARGRFGIIICRKIEDKSRIIQKCRLQHASNGNYIIVLSDDDIQKLANFYLQKDEVQKGAYLDDKMRELLM